MKRSILFIGLMASTAACGNSSTDGGEEALPTSADPSVAAGATTPATATPGPAQTGAGPSAAVSSGPAGGQVTAGPTGATGSGGSSGGSTAAAGDAAPTAAGGTAPTAAVPATGTTATTGTTTGGASGTAGAPAGGSANGGAVGAAAGSGGQESGTGGAEPVTAGAGGRSNAGGAGASATGGSDGGSQSSCVGDPFPSANPANAGPFQVAADKNVGPLAGVIPDPIYGNEQQRYNVYRPANLADSGYCHPILIWANGYTDNPEPNPPECVVDSAANKWCGQYLPMMNHLASHGFVVVASLSTATAEGDPLPTIAGLDWILEQAEDPSSPYYHRLDTNNIGQLGHSYGAMSTCMTASEPRYKALAAICGTRELTGVHTPMLFFCGGKDTTVKCSGVHDTFLTVTDQPAFYIDELNSDHGSWVYQGAGGVSLSMAAAWFRAHLMDDAESRKFFYGPSCTFCSDNRVEVEQNSLMAQ